jgi:hypothetical protein
MFISPVRFFFAQVALFRLAFKCAPNAEWGQDQSQAQYRQGGRHGDFYDQLAMGRLSARNAATLRAVIGENSESAAIESAGRRPTNNSL